ncbi:VIT1/CCC1 transporter family protein [Cyanobium sp. ATX 6F1]|uniref:VIT1/CCC1 transporter family protein n=1 Tax=unclassified Cyanobium TaxID=2627006 RepID=UPI0020CE2942|nr:VIT1/CCC1 transporter family protein [Cyanobium sp. ATX 6F1]MCP9916308.1 VIT1/CCC1 transporter family protein [Cyanobium sp. ATX 6F1]
MPRQNLLHSLRSSFEASIGDVVFGMEDGTVSIFGLVAGVALTASSGKSVLIAGASGAVAAAVSMMAGVFLDLQSEQDQERVDSRRRLKAVGADPTGEIAALMGRLGRTGLQPATLAAIESDLQQRPATLPELERRAAVPSASSRQQPWAHALWMLVSDLFAGLTPVMAFALLPLEQARPVSLLMTLVLLVLLGYGRARIGERAVLPTVLTTVSIAGCAALAGVAIGLWLNRIG